MKTAQVLAAAPRLQRGRLSSGFTLVELMVVIALIGVILALAAPTMRDMIDMRRLRAINAQLVTDMQFARSEAVAKRAIMRVRFRSNTDKTCYTIYTATNSAAISRCDCLLGEGSACSSPSVEVKTVVVPRSARVSITMPALVDRFAYEPTTGSLVGLPNDLPPVPLDSFEIDTAIVGTTRILRVALSRPGRPVVCAPAGSTLAEPACP